MYKYELPKQEDKEVSHGDIRVVYLPVEVVFQWVDDIVTDRAENGTVLETTGGFGMEVLPNQRFVYNGQASRLVANTKIE